MKEFINSLSTNDKIIVVFSMIMLAISVTELIVFGISDILILKWYIVMTTTVVFIEQIMYILCVNFGYMLKVNVNRKDYWRDTLEAYNPKDDAKDTK